MYMCEKISYIVLKAIIVFELHQMRVLQLNIATVTVTGTIFPSGRMAFNDFT